MCNAKIKIKWHSLYLVNIPNYPVSMLKCYGYNVKSNNCFKKITFSNPHIGIFLYWFFRFLNSVIVLIEVIYEIIIHLILKSSFLSTKSAQQTLSTNPKKRYLNSNNSQCSVTSKQNIYIKKRYSMYTI